MTAPVPRIAYSPTEAASAIGVCRGTIYKLIDDGRLRAYKVGNLTKIPVADVARLVGGEQ